MPHVPSHPDPLRRAVAVMDRLRSPGGCPWDAEQTHESLTRYLLEETYEVLEAIETGDIALLREELGDLLLQVLFHARITEERPDGEAFGIDDIAADLVDKLVARHPHVFAGVQVADVDEQVELWEKLKVAEKGRTSAVDGVPLAQPALALTAKLISRADRARRSGLQSLASGDFDPRVAGSASPLGTETRPSAGSEEGEIGARLFELVREAVDGGVDPEAALRRAALAYRDAIRAAETSS